jgi:hypothetical protein
MLTVVIAGVLMIADMVFAFHLEGLVFAPAVLVPVFIAAYLVAPLIEKYIRYK